MKRFARFALACLGVLALSIAFHLGATSSGAGAGGPFVALAIQPAGSSAGAVLAMTASGEVWRSQCVQGCDTKHPFPEFSYWGTIGGTASVPNPGPTPSSWGQVKAGAGR